MPLMVNYLINKCVESTCVVEDKIEVNIYFGFNRIV